MEAKGDLQAMVRGCSSFTYPLTLVVFLLFTGTRKVSPLFVKSRSYRLGGARLKSSTQSKQLFLSKSKPFRWHNTPLSSCSSSLASILFERTKSSLSSLGHVQRLPAGFRAGSQASKSKKRKNTQKKVCKVPVEGVSSDVRAW